MKNKSITNLISSTFSELGYNCIENNNNGIQTMQIRNGYQNAFIVFPNNEILIQNFNGKNIKALGYLNEKLKGFYFERANNIERYL